MPPPLPRSAVPFLGKLALGFVLAATLFVPVITGLLTALAAWLALLAQIAVHLLVVSLVALLLGLGFVLLIPGGRRWRWFSHRRPGASPSAPTEPARN